MTRNVGVVDRSARMILGFLLIAFGLFVIAGPMWKAIAFVIAGIMLVTAAAGTCPLYSVAGLNTCKKT